MTIQPQVSVQSEVYTFRPVIITFLRGLMWTIIASRFSLNADRAPQLKASVWHPIRARVLCRSEDAPSERRRPTRRAPLQRR